VTGKRRKLFEECAIVLVILVYGVCAVGAQGASIQSDSVVKTNRGVRIETRAGELNVEIIAPNVLRIDVRPGGKTSPRTPVLDPAFQPEVVPEITVENTGAGGAVAANLHPPVVDPAVPPEAAPDSKSKNTEVGAAVATILRTPQMVVTVANSSPFSISVTDAAGKQLVREAAPLADARSHRATFDYAAESNLYGMSGLAITDTGGGLLRNQGSPVAAGAQGEGGAPFFFSPSFGVVIDSDGGTFEWAYDDHITFNGDSRDEVEYFVITGPPMDVMSGLAKLTGRPPLPPKWTFGFLNSQWGSDEAEIRNLAATYRAKHIPIDAFILDYDWKAWGEDNYGEWRWNSTSDPGNVAPGKFPSGASGALAKELGEQGFKFAGILKPKILVSKLGSETEMTEAAAYADQHGFWYPGEPGPPRDFWPGWGPGGRAIRDLDFSNADARAWFWQHLEPSFDAGMHAWWNDEADHAFPWWHGGVSNQQTNRIFNFNNLQFFNMGRMLYEGQRKHSDLRVWSINRNYYLGAQRYGYAEWSGDIITGFESMRLQRARMLATLDLGEPHWSMDTGGFEGHPTPENYARWMEFAAFVPIDRVHGTFNQKRQPWVYGPIAEAAATRALRLRYKLLPYIYSYERIATETGVGIVRPLFWAFPDDAEVANESRSWMFGDAFLVSPVVERGASTHAVYLPAGTWYDYSRGTKIAGGRTITYKVDPETWQDIPLFVRAGSIVATQPTEDYVDQHLLTELTLDVFPAKEPGRFVFYDDDGATYAYEKGVYYRQSITAYAHGGSTHLEIDAPAGSFETPLRSYLVKVHGDAASAVLLNGTSLPKTPMAEFEKTGEDGWAISHDRFGPFTILRITARDKSVLVLQGPAKKNN